MESPRIETICAQAREDRPPANRPLIAPIYQSAVWSIESVEQCEAIYDGEVPGFIYTRDANPNHTALEAVIASLEQTEAAVVFGSGMAAIAAALTATTGEGGRIVASSRLYGATTRLLREELSRFGVEVVWADSTDLAALEAALAPRADVLLVETAANPLLEIADLPALAEACRRAGALLVVDNTFTPPPCCRPAECGADLVVHSVTKFLGGHSDLILGAVAGRSEPIEAVRRASRLFGGSANPFECWLALRGIATLPLRMERASANALELARRLEGAAGVRRVYYPGLESHPQHALAARVLPGSGTMLAFELESGQAAREFIRGLRRVRFAPSLGDVATTVSYPAATSHRALTAEQRRALGITDGVVRVSAGIDHVEDVWADFEQALGAQPRGARSISGGF